MTITDNLERPRLKADLMLHTYQPVNGLYEANFGSFYNCLTCRDNCVCSKRKCVCSIKNGLNSANV